MNTYDNVPYPIGTQPSTQLGWMDAWRLLYGVTASKAAVDADDSGKNGVKVLELGCAQGGNLIPMAAHFPGVSFTGIDLSKEQIAQGNQFIGSLGLKNLELHIEDFTHLEASQNRYDFIIAHGLFSWIPKALQTKLLAKINALLSEDGIAYVSYNTYPGWKMREVTRELVIALTETEGSGLEQVKQTRNIINQIADSPIIAPDSPLSLFLNQEANTLAQRDDAYIAHDLLEADNHPVSYLNFCKMVETADLQIVGDAQLGPRSWEKLPEDVIQTIESLTDAPQKREYLADIHTNRSFRRTLICHDFIKISQSPIPKAFLELEALSILRSGPAGIDLRPNIVAEFYSEDKTVQLTDTMAKIAQAVLVEAYPSAVPFTQLLERADALLQSIQSALTQENVINLCAYLAKATALGQIELYTHLPEAGRLTALNPKSHPLCRWQAQEGLSVVNRHHKAVKLSSRQTHPALASRRQSFDRRTSGDNGNRRHK